MLQFVVAVEGIETLREIRELGPKIKFAAVQAINKVARDQRAEAARRITDQINVPKSYVSPAGGRLVVSQQAQRTSLEARITARGRPTSLARFSRGTPGKAGVTVEVKPGQSSFMRRAFLIRLPQGSALTDTRFNLGLAIRLRPGERLQNKVRQVKLDNGLYLLYGPSVQQVFLDNQGRGVADDLAEPTADYLEAEFARLLAI
jgi:hypothetical protein